MLIVNVYFTKRLQNSLPKLAKVKLKPISSTAINIVSYSQRILSTTYVEYSVGFIHCNAGHLCPNVGKLRKMISPNFFGKLVLN